MKLSSRTTLIAGTAVLIAGFAATQPANAAESFLDSVDGKTVKDLRAEVSKRMKTTSKSSTDKPKIKINRAKIRSLIDQYLSD